MAIIRCPYCHAIIDENDKYCNNCGTQLLFTEDEAVEEEIPGEKIIDADVEEKDYTVDEPGDEKRPVAAKDLDTEIDEDLERELREETEEMALDELVAEVTDGEAGDEVTEEVILVDEIAVSEAKAGDGSRELAEEETAEPKKAGEEAEEDDEEEEEEKEEEKDKDEEDEEEDDTTTEIPEPLGASGEVADVEYIVETPDTDIASTAGESALRPLTFDTRELESIGETVELGKEKIDSFVAAEAGAEPRPEPPAPAQAPEKAPTGEPPTGTLPPWASTMKGAPVFPEDTGPVETRKIRGGEPGTPETLDEVEIFPRHKVSDSTIGLPERISQSPLPFDRTPTGEAPGEEGDDDGAADAGEAAEGVTPEAVAPPVGPVRPARQPIFPIREPEPRESTRPGIEPLDESHEPAPRPPFSFSVFFKSKVFDILFVGLFWLVALWLAAGSMGMTLFEILGSMSGSMLLLYAVFVFLYFFLFKFFLGETLGDRLFRTRE